MCVLSTLKFPILTKPDLLTAVDPYQIPKGGWMDRGCANRMPRNGMSDLGLLTVILFGHIMYKDLFLAGGLPPAKNPNKHGIS